MSKRSKSSQKRRRYKAKAWRRARKYLPNLLRKQGGLCFFCDSPIIRVSTTENIVSKDKHILHYKYEEHELVAKFATVDHLIGVSDDKHNEEVVASCSECNSSRGVWSKEQLPIKLFQLSLKDVKL